MSESGSTTASAIVRQTRLEYEEMRRKLTETEKKLNKLARLEARGQLNEAGSAHTQTEAEREGRSNPQMRKDGGDHGSMPDLQMSVPSASTEDVHSVRSELSTMPGSYTGFANRQFPASTPSRPALQGDHGAQPVVCEEVYDSDSSGSLRQGQGAGSSSNSVKLLRQNQRLLSEVERLVCELQAAKQREGELGLELESSQSQVAELQERVEELKAEIEAQDKALRSAEQHLSESQKQTSLVQQELSSCQLQIQDLRADMEEEKKARKSVEDQRDEAIKNFLEAQTALEDFQRRNHERMKTLEESEDHLRDSLAHTNAERDELLQTVDSLQSTVSSHEAEIERLHALQAVEQETKDDMEAQNLDLRRQLAKLTTRLHKAEEDCAEVSRLRQENAALLCEVEESREVINQLEDIADQLRRNRQAQQSGAGDDSGNVSIYLGASMQSNTASAKAGNLSSSLGDARWKMAAEGNTNNNGSTISNLLSELRGMLCDMDTEIQRLRMRVITQEDDQRAMRDLRSELTSLMHKADIGERQVRELEKVIGKLESDKTSMARQLAQQEEELGSRDSQLMSVESRLAQRNSQIIELQEDGNRRCEEITRLEKELWRKSATISQCEAQLEERRDELNSLHSQLTQANHNTAVLEDELKVARQKLKTGEMELEKCRAAEHDTHAMLSGQCRQFERQLEMLRIEVDAKETCTTEMQCLLKQVKQESADKENLIHQLETTLLETKNELSETIEHHKEMANQLEKKLSLSSQENQQLESALLLCRNEIAEHLSSMERTRHKFDTELSKRDQAIDNLADQVRTLQSEIDHRTEDNERLERELVEKHTSLQHCQSRIAQLQHSQEDLKDNVKQLQQQLMKEKSQWMIEADELERKLSAQSADLDSALAKCSDFKQTIKELQDDAVQADRERSALERALQTEKAANQNYADRVGRLEKDLRDLRVELEQKMEMVNDLEDTLRNKDADLDQQRCLIEQLDVDKLHMQREVKQLEESRGQLQESVDRLQFDGRAKEQILNDTREMLRKTEGELNEKTAESNHLHEVLEERQRELQERMKAVQQLEQTISETQDEMSKRMQRVDTTLHKYETEITERTAQIADLDDRLKDTQSNLIETSRQLQQQQQLSHRQQIELQGATAKVDELENTNTRQKQRIEEQRKEIVDITQDMRLTREQHQTEHVEFLSVRRDLAASRREVERLARELEEREAAQLCTESDTARLSEELGASQARAAQVEAKLAAHDKQHDRDMVDLEQKHKAEMDNLRRARDEAIEQHSQSVNKIRNQSQQMSENERLYRQRLDSARCELDALQNELSSRRELIRNATDTICMKDHEIATLKAEVSRLERQSQVSTALASDLDRQCPSTSCNYFLSSGPHNPLTRHDLSHNNANSLPAHSINELPMKDTWSDKDPQDEDYAADHLIFSFERLGSGLGDAKSDGEKDTDFKTDTVLKSDVPIKSQPPLDTALKKDSSNKKGGVNGGRGGVRSAGNNCVTFKTQAVHTRALSAPTLKSQSLKLARRKGKAGAGKVSTKKGSSDSKAERGDFSHHYKDPETLVSTYKGGASPSVPEKEMEDLHQQIQVNALRQQEIERQLRSLDESSDSPPASDDLIDLTTDPK